MFHIHIVKFVSTSSSLHPLVILCKCTKNLLPLVALVLLVLQHAKAFEQYYKMFHVCMCPISLNFCWFLLMIWLPVFWRWLIYFPESFNLLYFCHISRATSKNSYPYISLLCFHCLRLPYDQSHIYV